MKKYKNDVTSRYREDGKIEKIKPALVGQIRPEDWERNFAQRRVRERAEEQEQLGVSPIKWADRAENDFEAAGREFGNAYRDFSLFDLIGQNALRYTSSQVPGMTVENEKIIAEENDRLFKLAQEAAIKKEQARQEYDAANAYKYNQLAQSPDFMQKSSMGLNAYDAQKAERDKARMSEATAPIGFDINNPADAIRFHMENIRKDTDYMEPGDGWTPQQRQMYGYLFSTNRAEADKYAESVNRQIYAEKTEAQKAAIAEKAVEHPFLATAGNLLTMPTRGADALSYALEYAARGDIKAKPELSMTGMSNAVLGGISQNLNEKYGTIDESVPVFGGKGFGDAYQLVNSIIESAASVGLGGEVGSLAMFFGNAASAGIEDAIANGGSAEQALASGLAQGIAEVFFEKFSVDQIIKMRNTGTLKSFIGDFFKSGVIEGSEELATSVANILTDTLIMGEKSETNDMIITLMQQGMSYEDARQAAYKQAAEGLAYDFFGGAVSGAAHTGMVGSVNAVEGLGRYKGDTEALKTAANLRGDEQLKALAQQTMEKKKVRNRDAQKLSREIRSFDRNQYQQEAQSRMDEAGLRAEPMAARAISKQMMGEELSGREKRSLQGVDAKGIGRDIMATRYAEKQSIGFGKVDAASISDNGKTKLKSSGKDVEIKKLVYDAQDGIKAELKDGSRVSTEELSYSNKNQAILYETVGAMDVSEYAANKIVEGYKPETNAAIYVRGVAEAYRMGMFGVDKSQLQRGFASDLSKEQRLTAYELGQAQTKADTTIRKQNVFGRTVSSEGRGMVNFKGDRANLTERQRTSLEVLDKVAEKTGIRFEVFESYLKDGKRVYKDKNSNEVAAPNGFYEAGTGIVHIDLNAGNKGEGTMLYTASHELTHYIRDWSPESFKNLADFLMEQYGEKGVNPETLIRRQQEKAKKNGRAIDYDTAYEEFVADSMESMLTSENVLQQVEELKTRDKSLVEKIKDWFRNLISKLKEAYKGMTPETAEGRFVSEMISEAERLQNLWAEGVKAASAVMSEAEATAVEQLGKGAEVVRNAGGEMLIAKSKDKSVILYSESTWRSGNTITTGGGKGKKTNTPSGKEALRQALLDNGHNIGEVEETIGYVDDILKYIKDLTAEHKGEYGYSQLEENLTATIITNVKTGRQVLSTLVSNGDYPVNLDLTLTCKKRVAYMKVMTRLIQDGVFDKVIYDGKAIAKVNEILRKNEFETACLGCFVESRRLQFQNWAETIVNEWNEEVTKRNPDATPFSFAQGRRELTADDVMRLTTELEDAARKPNGKLALNAKGNVNLGTGDVKTKMGRLLDKLPSMEHTLSVEDLLNPEGLKNLREHDTNLFSIVQQRYGAASPKIVQEFNPYASEIALMSFSAVKDYTGHTIKGAAAYKNQVKKDAEFNKKHNPDTMSKAEYNRQVENEAIRRYLYAIGGARMQSFSDFMISNTFDYFQMFADLAARRFPMHGYSKEAVFLRLFGMTGGKLNGSLIAHVENKYGKEYAGLMPFGTPGTITVTVDGKKYGIGFDDYARHMDTKGTKNESFIQSIGIKDIVALQLDPRYANNVGSITIGVSDKQIRAMLNSDYFRMVIPYHKSGMIPEYAKLVGVDNYNDYTDYQETRVAQFYDKEGNAVEKLSGKVDLNFDFNEAVQRHNGDAKAAADEYIVWCRNPKKHPVVSKGKVVGHAELAPKFSDSPIKDDTGHGYDFTQEENYYKLLEDFNVYNSLTGKPAKQGAVRMNFPSEQNKLSAAELEAYKEALKKTGLYTADDIKKYLDKAQMSVKDIIAKELKDRKKYGDDQAPKFESTIKEIEDALRTPEYSRDVKFSARDSEGNELSPQQQEFFRDSKVRDENGNLRVLYHGTNTGEFYTFDGNLTGTSNDAGFFGDGFYFAFTKGEARFYGSRIIESYLNLKNPFPYIESFYGTGEQKNSSKLSFYKNLKKLFPELSKNLSFEVLKPGAEYFEKVPAMYYINKVENIVNSPELKFEEVDDYNSSTGKSMGYTYRGQNLHPVYGNTETKEMRWEAAEEVLKQEWWDEEKEDYIPAIYSDTAIPNPTEFIVEHAKEFTAALKKRGYDGVLQSYEGDEAVAFYPEQIKEISNKTPTSNPDIRYSARSDEQTINNLRAEIAKLEDNLEMSFDPETGEDFSDSDYTKMENRLTKLYHELDKMVEKEGKATVKTSIDDILANLHQYRRSDLESLAEQVSDGSWDDYEELSRFELEDALRESIEEIAGDLTALERQAPKFGYFVRPVEGVSRDNVIKFPGGDTNVRYSGREDETKPIFQTYTSAATSLPQQLPALFTNKNAKFVEGGTNVDIGAGKTPKSQEFLAERGVSYYPFDPFNRSREVNLNTLNWLRDGNRADTVTCANVLNVIDTAEGRSNVILEAAKALKPDGTAYFTTYEGSTNTKGNKAGDGIARRTGDDTFQNYRKTKTYVDEIWQWFDNVERKGSLIIAKEPKQNLPRASWEITPGEAVLYSAREDLDEKQQKSYDYNQKQTETGATLKTLNGSAIKRSPKYGNIGKDIGGEIYAHKNYAKDIVPQGILETAQAILERDYPDFKYNALKYNPKKGVVAFQEAPDFDTAREPVVGDYISVNVETGEAKKGHSNYIWHHKWIWVRNDYKGFDVAESWNWSKRWLSTLTEPSDGNGIERWNRQLDRFGLPHDGEEVPQIRYSERDPDGVSNRSLLANALEEAAKTDAEHRLLKNYKKSIADAESYESKLQEIRQQQKGKKGDELRDLKIKEKQMANNLDTIDKRLLRMESMAPLKALLNREKTQALEKAGIKSRDKLSAVRADARQTLRETKKTAKQDIALREKALNTEMKRHDKRYQKAMDEQGKRFDKALAQTEKAMEAEIERHDKRFEQEMLSQAKVYENVIEKLERENAALQKRVDSGEKALEETILKNRERLKKLKHNRDTTAMRHKVLGVVKQLNDYLLNGTEKKHVLESMQKMVAEALDVVNMDTVGATDRLSRLYEKLNKAKSQEERGEILDSINRINASGGKLGEKLARFKQAYNDILKETDPLVKEMHDDVVEGLIDATIEKCGDTSLRDMSLEQLETVYDMYRAVLKSVQNANRLFREKRAATVEGLGLGTIHEVRRVGGENKFSLPVLDNAKRFLWNNQKPVYAFKAIGSDTLSGLFDNVRAGEDIWARDMSEARDFYRAQAEKYGSDEWDMEQMYEFKTDDGKTFRLNLDQIMSLYAYSKREQALEHLNKGGIVFSEDMEIKDKLHGIPVTYKHTDANTYSISPELLSEIVNKLTDKQRAFATMMQDYLSTTMGAKGNEVSMELYGIRLFKEKNYWPLRVADQYMAKAKPAEIGQRKLKSSGFTKPVKPKAGNPVVLNGFMNTWADHVNGMSNYHAFVLPMEDFYKVYNFSTKNPDGSDPISVNSAIQNAYGRGATSYIDTLLKDLNGGAIADPRENTAKRLIGKFKKAAVFASASVVVQQPSAIGRAFAVIDPKYFVGPKMDAKKHADTWAELKKYAPVAVIKEMGYFDTNVGRSGSDYLLQKDYTGLKEQAKALVKDEGYRDEILSKAPALADEVTWCAIWEAAKREQYAKGLRGEALLQAAAERFTKTIVETQVYDSILSRSANMRAKSLWMTLMTSFGAEPTTSINMIENAIIEARRGNKAGARRAVGAVITSVILNSLLVSLVYAARDDDEDETYLEKFLSSFTTETLDGLNPITYYPFLRDLWSSAQGFDIERADMTLISGMFDSIKRIVKSYDVDTEYMDEEELEETGKARAEAWWSLTDYVTALMGLPEKNIRRDIIGGINLIKTLSKDVSERDTSWASLVDKLWDEVKSSLPILGYLLKETKGEKLYKATIKGQDDYRDRLRSGYKTEAAADSALRSALRSEDKRIHEAAELKYSGNMSGYFKLAREIISDTGLTQDDVVKAINSEISAIKSAREGEKASSPSVKVTGFFKTSDYVSAALSGKGGLADIKNDIIKTDMANGKTKDEAEKAFKSAVRGGLEDAVIAGEADRKTAYGILCKQLGYDKDDAEDMIRDWEFQRDYPDFDWGKNERIGYYTQAYKAGISMDAYDSYLKQASLVKGKDENGDGKTDSRSVQKQKVEIIDSLPLTPEQKDALYLAQWSPRYLGRTPWH